MAEKPENDFEQGVTAKVSFTIDSVAESYLQCVLSAYFYGPGWREMAVLVLEKKNDTTCERVMWEAIGRLIAREARAEKNGPVEYLLQTGGRLHKLTVRNEGPRIIFARNEEIPGGVRFSDARFEHEERKAK